MKKLNGIKKSSSSLENKKLTDLTAIQGGRGPSIGASGVYSNFLDAQGRQDMDCYDQYGAFSQRIWVGDNCESLNANW
jgi:putative peptide modification target (TIGR04139 family)